MPARAYLVTINVTRTFVVDTATELHLQALDPAGERGRQADWDKLYAAVHIGAGSFIDDPIDNIVSVELDDEHQLADAAAAELELDGKSDDPLE